MKKNVLLFVVISIGCCIMAQQVQYSSTGLNGTGKSYYDFTSKTVYIANDVVNLTGPSIWGHPKGIDFFSWTMKHEKKHHEQLAHFWPDGVWDYLKDADQDWIPYEFEGTYMPGRNYLPYNARTFPDEFGYDPSHTNIYDFEDICIRSQTAPYGVDMLWVNGSSNHLDWSNPGKQSKDKY